MEWNFRKDQDVLKRIIALLLAMASMADRASLASYPARRRVVEILLSAETVAQESVLGMARTLGAPIPPQAYLAICALMYIDEGEDPADAVRLALRLRIVAMALANLAAWKGRFSGRVTMRPQDRGTQIDPRFKPDRLAVTPPQDFPLDQPPDTS